MTATLFPLSPILFTPSSVWKQCCQVGNVPIFLCSHEPCRSSQGAGGTQGERAGRGPSICVLGDTEDIVYVDHEDWRQEYVLNESG